MVTGRGRKQIFGTVKDRIGKRISGWKEKLLSRAGKEVLIKAVLQAMPTYSMSCFRMPKGMCKELHGLMAKFWWSKSKNMRGIHWTKWETLCVSKQIGELGFRDLEAFNQALLAKQSWRLFFNCNSLAARIFKARYFPHCNFLEAGLGYRPSRIWSSLIWGKDLLKAGLRWRVGNGEGIYVYQDRWVPLPMNFKIISTPQFDVSMKVCELFNAAGQWDEELLKANFWEQEVKAILQIPLASNHREDKLIWHYDQSGKYSVMSGYMVACMKKQRENGMEGSSTQDGTFLWKKLWSLQVPNKIKFFLWRCIWGFLPSRKNLYHKKILNSPICPRCGKKVESVIHAIWACSEVKAIWSLSPWSANRHEWRITSFKDLWQAVIVVSSKQEVDLFAFLCWDIWNDRNNLLFQGRSLESVSVFNKALAYQTEFYSVTLAPICSHNRQGPSQSSVNWHAPLDGQYKINVDGAAKLAGLLRGVGVVIRNGNKEFMAACSQQVIGHFSAQAMELTAAKEGLQFAYDLGFRDIVLEMDAQGVVDRINSNEECFEAEGNIVEDIKEMQGWFRSFSCNWQRREGNKVAHELAQFGTRNAGFFTWIEEEPLWLTPFLSADIEANG
ncbi:unnamed protein product [Prunus armeniaca]